jgi:ribonucleoside-triphosphate reductase
MAEITQTEITQILKRDGRAVEFNLEKIAQAIHKAFEASSIIKEKETVDNLAEQVNLKLEVGAIEGVPTVEGIQDLVEETLIDNGFVRIAKNYMSYRQERSKVREINSSLFKSFEEFTSSKAKQSDKMRENANIDADTAMGTMLKFGSEASKQFYEMRVLPTAFARAHKEGDIHIHDLDFYTLTTTCCQIDIIKLFKDGFSTGHGVLREPNDIASYSALACIAIQSNQNDQHGGQSISNFDYGMALGVRKTYKRIFRKNLASALELLAGLEDTRRTVNDLVTRIEAESGHEPSLILDATFVKELRKGLKALGIEDDTADRAIEYADTHSAEDVDRSTFQAMEAFIHNLNTMHSRAGAQTPFSSINYGLDTTAEGRMVIKNVLLATIEGLGGGETPIFPIQIFRVKEGVNFNPEDPSYDLFKLACECSAQRLFPNFSFMDASFNAAYYDGTPDTEIAYMGCRTRVIGNIHDPEKEVTAGRGNLSFTSINLPRIGIKAKGDTDLFFELLDARLELVCQQLLSRMEIQSAKRVYNAPFLMGQGVWIDSDKLAYDEEQTEVLKHGTLSVGFIGLAETLVTLMGEHHGQSDKAQNLGLDIIGHMRSFLDGKAEETRLNFSLLATPAEGLSGRFVRMDRERYGEIEGVTDKDYYTNSFHVPVYYDINAFKKISLEAPYHALTNAGHISYIELDGDPTQNIDAFEAVIRHMHASGIGYGSVNHPVDRDPVCGYNGIIGERCPKCGREEGDIPFERIRRITGYLVGTLDRFNNAKRAEESQRVKHGVKHA